MCWTCHALHSSPSFGSAHMRYPVASEAIQTAPIVTSKNYNMLDYLNGDPDEPFSEQEQADLMAMMSQVENAIPGGPSAPILEKGVDTVDLTTLEQVHQEVEQDNEQNKRNKPKRQTKAALKTIKALPKGGRKASGKGNEDGVVEVPPKRRGRSKVRMPVELRLYRIVRLTLYGPFRFPSHRRLQRHLPIKPVPPRRPLPKRASFPFTFPPLQSLSLSSLPKTNISQPTFLPPCTVKSFKRSCQTWM